MGFEYLNEPPLSGLILIIALVITVIILVLLATHAVKDFKTMGFNGIVEELFTALGVIAIVGVILGAGLGTVMNLLAFIAVKFLSFLAAIAKFILDKVTF